MSEIGRASGISRLSIVSLELRRQLSIVSLEFKLHLPSALRLIILGMSEWPDCCGVRNGGFWSGNIRKRTCDLAMRFVSSARDVSQKNAFPQRSARRAPCKVRFR